ncbi:MAG TPA: GNAT family N-acetyltransferase [Phnomibacter sp.]|nr:GNAT family N-acetyltransferase [Phnomibacter sp.]
MNTATRTSIATASDAPLLVQHINGAYRGASSRAGWTTEADLLEGLRTDLQGVLAIINDPGADLHLFWNANNQLLACVYLQLHPHHLYLGMLTVHPPLQGLGIGKQVLHYAEQFARQHQKPAIQMTVLDARKELIAWYNRHGYQPTGQTEPWIDGYHIGIRKQELNFVVLEKKLAAADSR